MEQNEQIETENRVHYKNMLLRTLIKESWNRCFDSGLSNEDMPRITKVSPETLGSLLEGYRDILELASPYIKSLTAVFGKKGAIVGLSNKCGVILHIEGKGDTLKKFGYEEGYIHLESYMGTNAVGTCIRVEKPVMIWEKEHFLNVLREWAGFAAPIYGPDDYLKAVLFAMVPIKIANKGIIALISVGASSIERQLQLTSDRGKLLNMQEMMQEARNSMIEASSIISHEVRNSLTNISAYIQLLQLDKTINNLRADKLLKEIARVNRLLDDFKLLSMHKQDNILEQSLNEILQSVIDIMQPKAELSQVDIVYRIDKENIFIKADKNALHHVFINLIDNAIQAMNGGGTLTITVGVDSDTDEAIISFKDSGPGISSDQIREIFKIYHTTKKNGSGLGLHICKTLVKFHGGNMEVKSVEGQGATFFVRLPIDRS